MALDTNSAIGQADNIGGKLAEYYSKMSKYISGIESVPPVIADYISTMEYTELHRQVSVTGFDTPSFSAGAMLDVISCAVGIQRELGLALKLKSDYYSDGVSEYSLESDFYATNKVSSVSAIQGISSINSSQ